MLSTLRDIIHATFDQAYSNPHFTPAPESVIDRLRHVHVENAYCTICCETVKDCIVTQLPCTHEFCTECIEAALKVDQRCPNCRAPVSS